MVTEKIGDLLTSGANIICHQTNYHGIMGAGLAYAIHASILSDESYCQYEDYCAMRGPDALGTVQFLPATLDNTLVANLFCQNGYSYDTTGSLTNYSAMRRCLAEVRDRAEKGGLTVALPGYMGCGIAGGSWGQVRDIVYMVFDKSPVQCQIIYRE